jgi:hypothetical protein
MQNYRAPGNPQTRLLSEVSVMSNMPTDRFSEEQVKSLIARAIELDARGLTTTVEDVLAIASELGISSEAVEAALREHAKSLDPRRSRTAGRADSAVLASGVPLGFAAGSLLAIASPFTTLGALGLVAVGLVASGALVISRGKHVTVRSFLLRNLVLWGGMTIGSIVSVRLLVAAAPLSGLLLGWYLRSWVASTILGSAAIIRIRRAASTGGPDSGSRTGDGEISFRSRVLHLVKRTTDWLARPFRCEGTDTLDMQSDAQTPDVSNALTRALSA